MAPVHLRLRHKSASMASGDNRGQKTPLLTSAQYASVLKLRQNDKNNRGKKLLLYWCLHAIRVQQNNERDTK